MTVQVVETQRSNGSLDVLHSPKILTRSLLCASVFDILCWTGHEGKFLSEKVYEIRGLSLEDIFFSPERGDVLPFISARTDMTFS